MRGMKRWLQWEVIMFVWCCWHRRRDIKDAFGDLDSRRPCGSGKGRAVTTVRLLRGGDG